MDGDDYRAGALERLAGAFILWRAEQFAGAVSDAGRAVEGMLRAVIWKRDDDVRTGRKSLDTGHDLRDLLTHARNLGLLDTAEPEPSELEATVQRVARLWFNNMRFAPSKFLEARWVYLGEVRYPRRKGERDRTLKQASEAFYYDCLSIVKRCEVLCQK